MVAEKRITRLIIRILPFVWILSTGVWIFLVLKTYVQSDAMPGNDALLTAAINVFSPPIAAFIFVYYIRMSLIRSLDNNTALSSLYFEVTKFISYFIVIPIFAAVGAASGAFIAYRFLPSLGVWSVATLAILFGLITLMLVWILIRAVSLKLFNKSIM